MLKKLFFVFTALLIIVFSLLVFRYFYLRGMLSFSFRATPEPSPSSVFSPTLFPSDSSLPLLTPTVIQSPIITPPQRGKLVTIDVDDTAAGMYAINVASGTKVTLTINAMIFNVARGGLDFRSEEISTGNILPGQSKSVDFIFNKDLVFTPYYFDTKTTAPYIIEFKLLP